MAGPHWACSQLGGDPCLCSHPSLSYRAAGWGQRLLAESQSATLGPNCDLVVLGSNHWECALWTVLNLRFTTEGSLPFALRPSSHSHPFVKKRVALYRCCIESSLQFSFLWAVGQGLPVSAYQTALVPDGRGVCSRCAGPGCWKAEAHNSAMKFGGSFPGV